MNVDARKLNFIEEFIKITDETLIARMEELLLDEKKKSHERQLSPMSIEEFRFMIDKSKLEVEKGLVTSQDDLKKEIKSW